MGWWLCKSWFVEWYMWVHAQSFSCVWLFATSWTVTHQSPLSMRFSRQEYWSGFPCSPSGHLLDRGIEPMSLIVSAFAGRFFITEPLGKPFREISVQFSSVTQSCPTLCDPINHSTPGLPVHHQLQEFTQTYLCPSSRWCHPAISSSVVPFSSCPQSLPASESFPMSQLFAWGGQSTGVSALASVLPMNTQGWSLLEWTGWISLQSKGLSRLFSNTTV